MSNVGSVGLLAADACPDLGLTVHRPHGLTRRRLRALVSGTGTVTGPVDTGATVSGEDFRQCLELLAADDEVHAIIALVLPTGATGDLVAAIAEADVDIPLAAVVLNQPESVRLLSRSRMPEDEGGARLRVPGSRGGRAGPRRQLRGLAGRTARARAGFADIRAADARTLAREFLRQAPDGGWLSPGLTADLLACYGIPLAGGEDAPAHVAAPRAAPK